MNITQILQNLGENRADFIEALSDASHYLGVALDLLDRNDQVSLRALMEAEQTISQVLTACEDDDETLDFSGIEKAIADEGKPQAKPQAKPKKTKKSKNEFFGHAKALNAIKKQAKAQAAKSGGGTNV